MYRRRIHFTPTVVTRATAYDEQADELVIPEDLTTLSAEAIDALHTRAVEAFREVYQGGEVVLSPEDLDTLRTLNVGIEALRAQRDVLRQSEQAAAAEAATLAAGIEEPAGDDEGDDDGGDDAGEGDDAGDDAAEGDGAEDAEGEGDSEGEPDAVTAGAGRSELRVNMGAVRRRAVTPRRSSDTGDNQATGMRDIVHAAPNLTGYREGTGMDWTQMGQALANTLRGYPAKQYANAHKANRRMRQQFGLVSITKPFESDLIIESNDPDHVERVFARAMDETRLPGQSLTASGGWCAPSETIYDLCELESRDGLFSAPEVMVRRGGINHTLGPDFASLFADTGFHYTEAEDEAGDYDGDGGGSKPCFKVECPDFTDDRLELAGLCITAGLLQSRAYPEVLARTLRGALIAHDHRVAGLKIGEVKAGSTAVTMPASQVGATAPVLTAIGLQVEHYRDVNRLARNRSLEAIFPFWIREAIRADLARRQGVDLLSVPDARVDAWFRERGVNPQYVYNYQGLSLNTPASGAIAFPTSVEFLLYTAGTWVAGGSDVITLDTVYDSTLLGTNDFTALFSEEGFLMAKRCHDSRAVTVNICPDGATHIGVAIDCDGSAG